MRRADGKMIGFDEILLAIGGRGPHPTTPHNDATYTEYGITNECNLFNTTTSKYTIKCLCNITIHAAIKY